MTCITKNFVQTTLLAMVLAGAVLAMPFAPLREPIDDGTQSGPSAPFESLSLPSEETEGSNPAGFMPFESLSLAPGAEETDDNVSSKAVPGEGLSGLPGSEEADEAGSQKMIDPPIVQMPVACLKKSMKGMVLERTECPEGQVCTKGPIEIVKFDMEMKVWHCEKGKDASTGKPEKMLGDATREPDVQATTTPHEPAELPKWYEFACMVKRSNDEEVIKEAACESYEECSSKAQVFWLWGEEVEVHHCQKRPPTLPPMLQGLPDWLVCYLIRRGHYGANSVGEMNASGERGYVPVANC